MNFFTNILRVIGILVIIMFIVKLINAVYNKTFDEPEQANTYTAPPTALDITASSLYNQYNNNEIRADNNYKGKLLSISGTINTIAKDVFNDPYVTMQVNNNQFLNGVMFKFKSTNGLEKINTGDNITIQGICTGFFGLTVMVDVPQNP